MKRALTIFLAALLLLSCVGCAADSPAAEPLSVDTETVFHTPEGLANIFAFTVDEGGNVYAASNGNAVAKYAPDGTLIQEYPGTEQLCTLRLCGGALYGVDDRTKDIVRLDTARGETETVCADTGLYYIKSAAAAGKYICYVVIPSFAAASFEEEPDGYMNQHEKLFILDTETGVLEESAAVSNPIASYGASDGCLYIWAHPAKFGLYRLDPASGRTEQIDGTDDLGYVAAFALEDGRLVWSAGNGGIIAKTLPDGDSFFVTEAVAGFLQGCDFTFWRGNLLFPVVQKDESMTLCTLRLTDDGVIAVSGTAWDDGTEAAAEPRGSINIAGFGAPLFFNQETLQRRTGIQTKFAHFPESERAAELFEEFYTSLMAGDDSVDIYILALGWPTTQSIWKQGGYVPLSDSGPIRNYLDRCFDWVEDCAVTPEGEIWMLPLHFSTWALWYVPETFEKYGLTPDSVRYLDDFCDTVEMLNEVHTDDYADVRAQLWEYSLALQYESIYCDFDKGIVDFDTDEFRSLMDLMWTGFDMNTGGTHPFFEKYLFEDDRVEMTYREYEASPWNVPVHEIFSIEELESMMKHTTDLEAWRVLPNPRLDERVETNIFDCICAIVNPCGKNRDLAVEYLEAIASDSLHTLSRPDFVLKDPADYSGACDMTKPVYQDLYEIYRDGSTFTCYFPQPERSELGLRYQAGELTLDEFVKEIQRRAEFMARE